MRVLVLFRDQSAPVNGSIKWKSVELTNGGSGSRWTGGSPIVGTNIEWLVQALDAQGNVATSSNKARYFDAAPAQSGSGIAIGLAGSTESPTGYFAGPVTVTATGPAGVALTRRVDGGTERSYTGSFQVSGDGLHVVEINGSDGSSSTRAFVIDTSPPLPPIIVTPPTPEATYTVGDVIAADYRCRDTSGIKSCVGTVGGNPAPSGSPLPTNSIGQKTLSVTATDVMDRTAGPVTRTYRVIWSFGAGFLTPVDNPPAVNLVAAGQSVPVRFSLGGDFGLGILAQARRRPPRSPATRRRPSTTSSRRRPPTAGSASRAASTPTRGRPTRGGGAPAASSR